MKKIYFLLAVFFAASVNLMAQTDVTATYLSNPGFDEAPTIFTLAVGGKVSNADTDYRITRVSNATSQPGWRFNVTGWDETSFIIANAVQIATAEYGFTAAPTLSNQGLNTTIPPLTLKNGATATGACLHMSAGWGDKAIISKAVALQSGKYKLFYDAYNANATATSTGIATNFCGYSNGTTKVVSSLKTFPQYTWKTDSVTFTILSEADNDTINIGFTTSANGSGNGAKLFIDNVKLLYYGVDKTDLKALIDSATVMNNNRIDVGTSTVYTDLSAVITAANSVFNNISASIIQISDQETALKTAIANVYDAIILQTRKATWTTFPYDATSAIVNPSFESGFTGWTNVGFQVQTNASFDPKKVGTTYAEKWVTSGTALTNLRLSQLIKNIPNGIYLVKASAHALEQTGPVYPGGAYIFGSADIAEVFAINDYAVQTTVTDNVLEIGYEITTTGNWVAVDNFQLTYVSDGSPYMLINPTALTFTPSVNTKTINVKGGNLTGDITLAATPAFSLSKTSITAAEAMAEGGVNVDVVCNGTTDLPNDSIVLTSGALRQKVSLAMAQSAINTSTAALFYDQSLPIELTFNVSGDLYSNVSLSAPAGITLSETTITPVDALAGKAILATWNGVDRIAEKYIYLTSGVKTDSVLVFAVNDNVVSTWDGDYAEVAPSKMTDFGWSQTLADGISAGPVVFNEYNVTGGSRYVPATNAAHTYRAKTWIGHRVAYMRAWGDPATNAFNLSTTLEAGITYVLRAVGGWHNNETNPTFTMGVNTAPANMGVSLGSQAVACTIKQRGEDYGFEFTPTTTATHYVTVTSSVINDAMFSLDYLAIYPKGPSTGFENANATNVQVYPTLTNGAVNIKLAEKSGQINVYDVAGRMVVSKSVQSNFETVQIPSAGMYVVEIKNANITKTVKVIRVN